MSVPQEVLYRMAMEAEESQKQIHRQIRDEEEREWFGTYGTKEPEEEPMIKAMKDARFVAEIQERLQIYQELYQQFKTNTKANEQRGTE